jgi:hypothetical protein
MALYSSLGGSEGADDQGPSDATLGYRFALREALNKSDLHSQLG